VVDKCDSSLWLAQVAIGRLAEATDQGVHAALATPARHKRGRHLFLRVFLLARTLPPAVAKPCSSSGIRSKISPAIHHLATITRKRCTPIRGRAQIIRIMQKRAGVAVFAQATRKISAWPCLVLGMIRLATLLSKAARPSIRATALRNALSDRGHGGRGEANVNCTGCQASLMASLLSDAMARPRKHDSRVHARCTYRYEGACANRNR